MVLGNKRKLLNERAVLVGIEEKDGVGVFIGNSDDGVIMRPGDGVHGPFELRVFFAGYALLLLDVV